MAQCYQQNATAVLKERDEGIVLADPGTDHLLSLDPISAAVWRMLAEPASVDDIVDTVHEAFPSQARAAIAMDIASLIEHFVQRGLIVNATSLNQKNQTSRHSGTSTGLAHPVEGWDQFLAASHAEIGYKQSGWWGDFLSARGGSCFDVPVNEGGVILGGAKIYREEFSRNMCFYRVPEGPVLPQDKEHAAKVFEAFKSLVDQHATEDPQTVSHLRLEPRWLQLPDFINGYRESSSWQDPRHTLCIDLTMSEQEILAKMKPKGRYNIRLAGRKGVQIVEDLSAKGVADFLDIYDETFERHELRGHSLEYMQALAVRLAAFDCGSLLFAEHEGERLATALLIYFGDRVTYKYGGSRRVHRELMAPYLLHYEAIRLAKAGGYRWYDFYGIAPPDKPDDRWANFSVFKRKFGGCEFAFVPTMDFIYDTEAYEAYRAYQRNK